jgi:hypothetical protein
MKNRSYKSFIVAGLLALSSIIAMPAYAVNATNKDLVQINIPNKNIKLEISVSVKEDVDAKISARVSALNELKARMDGMQKVAANEKVNLDATIDGAISDMLSLKAKIDADTDAATFKTDILSIIKSYRIYVLVLPQGRITALGDRTLTIGDLMGDLGTKFQARINAAQASGKDVATLNAQMIEYNKDIADSNTEAQGAINDVAILTPDNGDKVKFQSNELALKAARTKIKVSTADLKAARQIAISIAATLKGWSASASAETNTTTK